LQDFGLKSNKLKKSLLKESKGLHNSTGFAGLFNWTIRGVIGNIRAIKHNLKAIG